MKEDMIEQQVSHYSPALQLTSILAGDHVLSEDVVTQTKAQVMR